MLKYTKACSVPEIPNWDAKEQSDAKSGYIFIDGVLTNENGSLPGRTTIPFDIDEQGYLNVKFTPEFLRDFLKSLNASFVTE